MFLLTALTRGDQSVKKYVGSIIDTNALTTRDLSISSRN